MTKEKILSQGELAGIVGRERSKGKVIGFTNGCFDIIHLGHVRYLAEAKKWCDLLVVGVNSDSSVKRLKGDSRPINAQKARVEVLASLESVDFVTIFSEDTPEKLINKLSPDILFKGGDWKEEEVKGAEHVKARGGKVKIISYTEGYSTTSTIKKLKG